MDLLILLLPFVLALVCFVLVRTVRRVRCTSRYERGHFYCPACHYDVSKAIDTTCSECGTDVLVHGVDHAEKARRVPVGTLYFASVFFVIVLAALISPMTPVSFGGSFEQFIYGSGLHRGWYDQTARYRHLLLDSAVAGVVICVYFGLPLYTLQVLDGINNDVQRKIYESRAGFLTAIEKNRSSL